VESLLSKAPAMKNDEGRSPGICFLKWNLTMSERSEDNPSLSARRAQNPRNFVGFLFSERAKLASASLGNKKTCGEAAGVLSKV
jgi:hypothetical protein